MNGMNQISNIKGQLSAITLLPLFLCFFDLLIILESKYILQAHIWLYFEVCIKGNKIIDKTNKPRKNSKYSVMGKK